ncbi:AI-2E family transporter [Sulfurovum sp. NBC37-1]|uniref:AI-2E family transporter n=1 Tax=Sulfurovum sp. (strain NBC37-1) TaxID=387093 RepID=UPI0001587674|nr:AI-2E family transporter [Sulfurovum sp. NBC37-1]BAF71548.1 conserved hypothetical protein [Sulfurovum sp. NBC37-1]
MQEQHAKIGYTLMVMASIVIILAGIKMAAVIIVPFLLALFLATILSPFYLWLKKMGVHEILALLIIVLFLFLVISSMITLIGNSVQDFSQNVPMYEAKLRTDLSHIFDRLDNWGIHVPKDDFLAMFHTRSVMHYIAGTLRSFGSLLTNSFMIIMTVIFMLMEISQFTAKLAQTNVKGLATVTEVSGKIKHYILLKTLTSAATGLIITIILKMLGIHYAVLWGLLAFLLNFIPNIGSILAAIPAVMMALVQFNITTALIAAGAYLLVNVLIGSILEPRILGKGLGLSTLIVFLSLIFWGWLLGPIGMLLSVPLTVIIKIVLNTQPNTKWIATMLGSGEDTKAIIDV